MSLRKIALGFALAGIVGATGAVAENEGSFVGGQITSSTIDTSYKINGPTATGQRLTFAGSGDKSGTRFGVVYGKYFAIDEDMGFRTYGLGDLGDSLYNVNANADFLYTFVKFEKVEIRGFVGAYVGAVLATFDQTANFGDDEKDFFWGIDAGMNIGARFVIAERHGIDLFYRYGFLEPESTTKRASNYGADIENTWKIKQSSTGLRYTFSF